MPPTIEKIARAFSGHRFAEVAPSLAGGAATFARFKVVVGKERSSW